MRLKLKFDKQTQTLTVDEISGDEITVSIGDPYDYDTHIDLHINLDVDIMAFTSNLDIPEEL